MPLDRPDWECAFWRRLFPASFVLCPRGILRDDAPPDDPRFTYEDDAALEREIEAGLAALAARFPARIDGAPMLWVGLSRGAFLGAIIAARQPARYPRMILVEGGHDPWAGPAAKAYADGGGRRVLFVCGQGACTFAARRAARSLEHFGVGARLIEVAGMGHGLNHDADAPIEAARDWLFE
jgi:pimeloyl-ACP methyl ester carboxylesterase